MAGDIQRLACETDLAAAFAQRCYQSENPQRWEREAENFLQRQIRFLVLAADFFALLAQVRSLGGVARSAGPRRLPVVDAGA